MPQSNDRSHDGVLAKDKIKEARRLFIKGDLAAAKHLCNVALEERPNHWQPHHILALIALKSKDSETAQHHITKAQISGAPQLAITKLEEKKTYINGDLPRRIQLLRSLISEEPNALHWHLLLIKALTNSQQHQSIFKAIEDLVKLDSEATLAVNIMTELANHTEPRDFLLQLNKLIKIAPDNWALLTSRAVSLAQSGNMDAAWEDIAHASKIDSEKAFPASLNQAIQKCMNNDDKYQAKLEDAFMASPRSASLLWHWANVLDRTGKVEQFRKLVRENWHWASDKNPSIKAILYMQNVTGMELAEEQLQGKKLYKSLLMANNIHGALEHASTEDDKNLLKQVLTISETKFPAMGLVDYSTEISVAGVERPNGVVLVFGGLADKVSVPPHVLDYFFAELGLTALYLRDFSRLIYLNGIKSLGKSLDETLTAIADMVSKFGPDKPLFTFGNSAGGLAAMIYGEALGAKSSLVFSPPATVNPADKDKLGEERAGMVYRRLFRNLDHTRLDLRASLERSHQDYHVNVYVGAESNFDRPHAEMIASMPKTNIKYIDGLGQHNAFVPAASRFGMLNILRDSFSL